MIKLGKLTDYAVAVMGQLAQDDVKNGTARSAHYLSEKTGVPEPTVAKVLKILAQGNLVLSLRGASGGYRLAKSADDISISEIITVMDGPIAIVTCADGPVEACGFHATCPTKGSWGRVNSAIKSALEAVKLADMIAPSRVQIFLKDIHADRA